MTKKTKITLIDLHGTGRELHPCLDDGTMIDGIISWIASEDEEGIRRITINVYDAVNSYKK